MNDKYKGAQSKSVFRKIGKILLIVCASIILLGALSVGAFFAWAESVNMDVNKLPTATFAPRFLDVDGNEIKYAASSSISQDDIPVDLKNAFVAVEDKRFYSHNGYDVSRIISATLHNISSPNKQGASTITQQLVKNTHLTAQKTLSRKLNEIAIARKIERNYTKDEILCMYLSVIYFGQGAYGVNDAARLFFDKAVSELSLEECATLAGIVKNPSGYSPSKKPEASKTRRNLVLSLMREQGYITQEQYEKSSLQPVATVTAHSTDSTQCYLDMVTKQACTILGVTKYELFNSGVTIKTAMDPALQQAVFVQNTSSANYEKNGVDGISIVLDNASGRVLAYVSTLKNEPKRQAGSVLKPLAVYAPALDMRLINAATPIVDEKTDFGGYSPSNFQDVYYGSTTPRLAVEKSMNTVAVKIMSYVTPEKACAYLNSMGIVTAQSDQNLALALGATSDGVTPLAVASAYAALGNSGTYNEASFIDYISDKNGIKQYFNHLNSRQTIQTDTAAVLTDMLVGCAQTGTAKTLSVLPFEIAAKTGTAQSVDGSFNTDAWCASYTKEHTLLVWHGSDKDTAMQETGGGHPTSTVRNIYKSLYTTQNQPDSFTLPNSVVSLEIDEYSTRHNKAVTLASANTPRKYRRNELFFVNSLPTEKSIFDDIVAPDFSVVNDQGNISIQFETNEEFVYTVECTDAIGTRLVKEITNASGLQTINDTPLSLGGVVDYVVTVKLLDDDNVTICSNEMKKSVYIGDSFPLLDRFCINSSLEVPA